MPDENSYRPTRQEKIDIMRTITPLNHSYYNVTLDKRVLRDDDDDAYPVRLSEREPISLDDANLVGSQLVTSEPNSTSDKHGLILDLDFPVTAIASSTPGHSHLYLGREITWEHCLNIMKAFVNAGLLEKGYYRASLERKQTYLRLPWVQK